MDHPSLDAYWFAWSKFNNTFKTSNFLQIISAGWDKREAANEEEGILSLSFAIGKDTFSEYFAPSTWWGTIDSEKRDIDALFSTIE